MSAASRSKGRERGTDRHTDTEREKQNRNMWNSPEDRSLRGRQCPFFPPELSSSGPPPGGRLIIGRRKPRESAINSPLIWSSWQRDGPISLLALEEEVCDGSRLPGKTQKNPANMVTTDFHFLFVCFCFSKVCQSGKTLYKITV